MAKKLLVFGSIAYDCIETPTESADFILGGSASFAALAASYFTPVRIVGVVGNDFKDDDIRRLTARGIDLSGLVFDSKKPTFFWRGKYHENFNSRDTLDVRLNAFENYVPSLDEESKKSEYALIGNISPSCQRAVLDSLENPKFTIIDTMDLWIRTENEILKELIRRVDILILNDSEAKILTGNLNLINAGKDMIKMGAKSVIVKKGEHGALLFHKDGFFSIGAYPLTNLHDPTGAGDSFAGALAGYLAQQDDTSFESIKRGMLAASATASLTLESFSCYKLEETGVDEIHRRMDYIRQISKID